MDNIILQLQKNNTDSVLNNDILVFDDILKKFGDVAYDNATGTITINKNGTYFIDWYVAVQSVSASSSIIFKLVSDKGDEFFSNSPSKTGNISGIAVLTVEDAPVNLSLVNVSNATAFFSNTVVSKANLRIFNLSNTAVTDDSRCFALEQFAHVIKQIVNIYQGSVVSIFSNRLAAVTGTIDSIYISPDAGSIPLLIMQVSDQTVALNINEIAIIYFPETPYDNSITYLPFPDSTPQNCDTDFLRNVHDYVSQGNSISVTTGPTTAASGDVYVNEYGVIVLADEISSMFISVPHIFTIIVSNTDGIMSEKKGRKLEIKEEKE